MNARMAPAERPYAPDMEETLARLMPPGVAPLLLFRTVARDPRLFRRFMAGGLLDARSGGKLQNWRGIKKSPVQAPG